MALWRKVFQADDPVSGSTVKKEACFQVQKQPGGQYGTKAGERNSQEMKSEE